MKYNLKISSSMGELVIPVSIEGKVTNNQIQEIARKAYLHQFGDEPGINEEEELIVLCADIKKSYEDSYGSEEPYDVLLCGEYATFTWEQV